MVTWRSPGRAAGALLPLVPWMVISCAFWLTNDMGFILLGFMGIPLFHSLPAWRRNKEGAYCRDGEVTLVGAGGSEVRIRGSERDIRYLVWESASGPIWLSTYAERPQLVIYEGTRRIRAVTMNYSFLTSNVTGFRRLAREYDGELKFRPRSVVGHALSLLIPKASILSF